MTQCPKTGKQTYGTKLEAMQVRDKIRTRVRGSRSNKRRPEHAVYRCRYCKLWHLSSTSWVEQ